MFVIVGLAAAVFAASDAGFAFLISQLTAIVADGDDLTERQQFVKQWLPVGVLILFLVRGTANFISSYGMGWIANLAVRDLRNQLFTKYLDLPTTFFDKRSTGKLLSKLTYDVSQIAESASNVVIVLIKDTLTIIFLVIYMTYLSPTLAVFVFVVAPLIAILVRYLSGLFRAHNRKIQAAVGNITQIGEEALQANRVVKVFGGRDYESERFAKATERNRRLIMRLVATSAIGDGVTVFVTAFGVAGVIFLISRIAIDVGTVAGFITAMVLLMAPLKRLTNVNATIQRGIAAGESLFRILDEQPEQETGRHAPNRVTGDVVFRQVGFCYDDDRPVLRNISFEVKAGETVALVGRSGSGKSTLVSLLPRFYNCTSGEILIDGKPLGAYSLAGLRRQISLVSQEVTLFNDTIASNIAYGGLQGYSRAEVERASAAAYVSEFAAELPLGLDSVVGDRGVLLSGGQRQRISIARALLKNAPILILDEATSALDTESERHIQSALEQLMQNRTTFVIAHRLSTVEKADRILVLQDGEIVESGCHADLLQLSGAYAALYRLQFAEVDHAPA